MSTAGEAETWGRGTPTAAAAAGRGEAAYESLLVPGEGAAFGAEIETAVLGDAAWPPAFWMAVGVMLYGLIYTFIHDGIVHQRFFRYVPRGGYAKRLVQAHRLHHATIGKEGGVSFGFVFPRNPAKLKAELAKQRDSGKARLRSNA